ncbi:MAG: hypothetical protein WEB04_11390 [Dehalococcoidia bacterium]
MRLFKQLAGYHVKKLTGVPLWQVSYYDHIVRADEDLSTVTDVLDNPVRSGPVDDRAAYSFVGPRAIIDDA